MKKFHDNFGNVATIEENYIFAYNGANKKSVAYRLTLTAEYDDNYIYHISVHEIYKEDYNKMKCYSCGEWQE